MTEKEELLKLKAQLEYIKKYIEENCMYDDHLQGYLFGLTAGHIRTLMYNVKTIGEKYDSGETFNDKRSKK